MAKGAGGGATGLLALLLALMDEGHSMAKIGRRMGVSRARAFQLTTRVRQMGQVVGRRGN